MKKITIFFLVAFCLTFLSGKIIHAVSLDDCEKDPSNNISDCISLFSSKVSDLSSQKKTLSSQIAQFDAQLSLTKLKISNSQSTLSQLEKEIGILGFRIGYVTESIDKLESLVKERIVVTYEQSYVSNLDILLSSDNFSDAILRMQYLKKVQENDKKVLANLQETKTNYANQKDERETKQLAIEDQKAKLEVLKTSLDQQKAEKQVFLRTTQNDESKYQRLLAQAQAEIAVTFGGGDEKYIRDVKAGDSIGNIITGRSGCSTGTHLHFEVHKNSNVDNPNNYLSNTSFDYPFGESDSGKIDPHGSLPWPISSPIHISQGYGMTPYALSGAYSGSPHFGIDMFSDSSNVKAVKDGKLYGGSYKGCSYGPLVYAKVKHDDGLDTLYLHTIPK
jgi:peptidoglycan hydrolase CwlO-like protein